MVGGVIIIVYIYYAIGIYLILALVLLPILLLSDSNDANIFLKPMPAAISFFPLYYGYHLIINKKIPGNTLYEIDLSMIPSWTTFLLGLFLIIIGFKILYESYIK